MTDWVTLALSLFASTGVLAFTTFVLAINALRRPETRFKLKRTKWVYALLSDALGELREHLVPLKEIQNSPTHSFKIGVGTYFWRPTDKQNRPTVFPYKRKLAAIYKRGIPFPEAFANESLSALGGYSAEEFTTIIESKVEENIVAAMRPRITNQVLIMCGIILIAVIGSSIYIISLINGLPHGTAIVPTVGVHNTTATCPVGQVCNG